MFIYTKMLQEAQRLEKEIQETQKIIDQLPEGKFICCQGKNCYKWYRSEGHTKTYIKKENRDLAEDLLYKKYLQAHIEDLSHEKEAIELYLHHHQDISKADQLMACSPEYSKLLSRYFKAENEEFDAWTQEEYKKNPKYKKGLVVKTCTGEYVRSKSEAYIYTSLHRRKIPFRYECGLEVNNQMYYPDFTIKHPKTGELFYWENYGLMDRTKYAKDSFDKLKEFYTVHIIPGINLITTYEDEDHPLSFDLVERLIEHYFM